MIMMLRIILLIILINSVLCLSSKTVRKSLAIVLPILSFTCNVNAATDLENGSKLFQSSCSSCHAGGGNSRPFSQGKTLSLTDLKTNGYDTADNIITIITKVLYF